MKGDRRCKGPEAEGNMHMQGAVSATEAGGVAEASQSRALASLSSFGHDALHARHTHCLERHAFPFHSSV